MASVIYYISRTHKRLKERFLIGQNRTKHANFRGSALFHATYNIKTEKQTIQLISAACGRLEDGEKSNFINWCIKFLDCLMAQPILHVSMLFLFTCILPFCESIKPILCISANVSCIIPEQFAWFGQNTFGTAFKQVHDTLSSSSSSSSSVP